MAFEKIVADNERVERKVFPFCLFAKTNELPSASIWEKKFGRNATHVKKQREITNLKGFSRTPGRSQPRPLGRTDAREPWRGSAREGFQSSVPRRQAAAFPHGQTSVNNSAAGARHAPDHRPAAISTVPPKPREERPLHPSWEAKKRQKEKQHAAILPSAGKKIKF